MTPEAISMRRAQLLKQREAKIADVHAIEGAIQECDFWLKAIEEAKKEEQM